MSIVFFCICLWSLCSWICTINLYNLFSNLFCRFSRSSGLQFMCNCCKRSVPAVLLPDHVHPVRPWIRRCALRYLRSWIPRPRLCLLHRRPLFGLSLGRLHRLHIRWNPLHSVLFGNCLHWMRYWIRWVNLRYLRPRLRRVELRHMLNRLLLFQLIMSSMYRHQCLM